MITLTIMCIVWGTVSLVGAVKEVIIGDKRTIKRSKCIKQ